MPAKNGVVAHFIDGRTLKGLTHDFSANRPSFHVASLRDLGESPGTLVRTQELKALFFVRDLEGDPFRIDLPGFITGPAETVHGKKIAVQFRDGELLCGYTLGYSARREAFFVFPADPGSNNLRVFVNTAATTVVCEGPAAEELARRIMDARAA